MPTYRTNGAWGSGIGVNLTPAQVDENFYELRTDLDDLIANPPTADSIVSISQAGFSLTFHTLLGNELGPVAMPVAYPVWRGDWQPATLYSAADIFRVAEQGIFVVLQDHTSAATFDPDAAAGSPLEPLYLLMIAVAAVLGSIDDLDDVLLDTLGDNDFLVYDFGQAQFTNRTVEYTAELLAPLIELDDLSNVIAPSPTAGQVLRYTGGSPDAGWQPDTLTLDDLGDVSATGPSDGYILKYQAGSPVGWVAGPPAFTDATLAGTTAVTGYLRGTYDAAGVYPASSVGAGWAIGSNFDDTDGGVDFWSTVEPVDPINAAAGFRWWQKSGASSAGMLAWLYGDGVNATGFSVLCGGNSLEIFADTTGAALVSAGGWLAIHGNVMLGLGTPNDTAPSATLHVAEANATARVYRTANPTNGEWAYIGDWGHTANIATYGTDATGSGTDRAMQLVTGGTVALSISTSQVISTAGALGVGISAPNKLLDVAGDASLNAGGAGVRPTRTNIIGSGDSGTSGGYRASMAFVPIGANGFTTAVVFSSRLTDVFNSTYTERMRIHSDGNVGIGDFSVNAPQAKLQIGSTSPGTARIYNSFTDASNGEWAYLGSPLSNIFTFGPDKNGTGTYRVGRWVSGGLTIWESLINGDFRMGTGTAIATTATGGFPKIPTCAGTPTGVPTNRATGSAEIVYDSTGKKLWIYDNATTSWKGVVIA